MKCNIYIIEIPEGEESEQEIENLFEEIMTENFPNLVKEEVTQVQEVQEAQSPNQDEPKEPWLVWLVGLSAGLWTKGSPVKFPV